MAIDRLQAERGPAQRMLTATTAFRARSVPGPRSAGRLPGSPVEHLAQPSGGAALEAARATVDGGHRRDRTEPPRQQGRPTVRWSPTPSPAHDAATFAARSASTSDVTS